MQPLTPVDVQAALDQFGLALQIRIFDTLTATSQQAADSIGCELGQIVKSLAFLVDDRPIVILASGDQRIDDRKIAALFEVSRKKIRIATPEQCIEIYGYAPGGVPPVGHRTPGLTVYIDDALNRYEQVYAAAGSPNAIFAVTLNYLAHISGGTFANLRRDETVES